MDNRRQLKIASVIQEAFTDILLRQGKSIYGKAFVTVTKVKVTSDLTLVRFYLSIYNAAEPDAVLQSFNEHKVEIKLRHDLRRIPEIEFFRDDTLDYVDRIETVFQKIKEEEKALAEDIVAAEKKPRKAPAKKKAAAPKKKSAK